MKVFLRSFLIGVLAFGTSAVHGQSLNDQLLKEDPAKLALDAREKGDIVRGAILFHQGNINCAKCHRPKAEIERIGPDLSRMDADVTDQYLIESILLPSKSIKEGFEAITALTVDGETVTGIKVSEDEQKIRIRDRQNVDRIVEIMREDLEGLKPSEQSSMPDNLVDALKNRQQFLDLLKYVIDIKERGPDENNTSRRMQKRVLSPELNGLVLIQRLNCVACHPTDAMGSMLAAKRAPRLDWSASQLDPNFLQTYIENPHLHKRDATMPALFQTMDETQRKETANAITHFLVGKNGNQYDSVLPDQAQKDLREGFELFHSVGCVACHQPRDADGRELPVKSVTTELGRLENKYDVESLVAFLQNPLAVRSSGHMPNMKLSFREANQLAQFLLQKRTEPTPEWIVDEALAARGKVLFQKHNCAACHQEFASSDELAFVAGPSLEAADPEAGCLSGNTGAWPAFVFSENEKEQIKKALIEIPFQLSDEQQIDVTMTAFNCLACHERNDLGGVVSDLNYHFKTTNLNLGDQGRIPPPLTGVGAKLKPKWLRDVLVNGRSIRPYMKTRMPQYGEQNVGHLVELFEKSDELEDVKFAEVTDQKEMRNVGLELAGNKGLNCVACHTYKYKDADTMPAVDLTEMAERLHKDWFYQYMLAPQRFSPNTVMPSFWPDGVAIRKDLSGTPADQLESLWQYLIDGRQARMPRGVVREPLEIVVENEAQMLRRSYPGIGKRGIGVGLPGGVNFAFDAEQMRLAMVWKGKFADPGGVWTGQGSGTVRALGDVVSFPKGPELDLVDEPWPVGDDRPPKHQFQGYRLDSARRPTFQYTFGNVSVEDSLSEAGGDSEDVLFLRRRVTFSAETDTPGTRFRIASGEPIKQINEREFQLKNRLRIRLIEIGDGKLAVNEAQQLNLQFDLKAGKSRTLLIEYWWD